MAQFDGPLPEIFDSDSYDGVGHRTQPDFINFF